MPSASVHHGSRQKHYFLEGAWYFATSVTRDRYPFFANSHIARVFIEDLWFACELMELELFGFTVIPDHVHVLFRPLGGSKHSEVVGSLKRNASRDINDLISGQPFVRNFSASPETHPAFKEMNDLNVLQADDSNRRLEVHSNRSFP